VRQIVLADRAAQELELLLLPLRVVLAVAAVLELVERAAGRVGIDRLEDRAGIVERSSSGASAANDRSAR
jgi:hypothetical protein